jgi:site-specific DNA recombinase
LLTVPREGAKECEFVMFNPMSSNEAFIKVALYARVSSEDQVERETIQNQVHIANTLCPAMGLEIVASYLDDGVSGTIPLEKRHKADYFWKMAQRANSVRLWCIDWTGSEGLA